MKEKVRLIFGLECESINRQLKRQNLKFNRVTISEHQRTFTKIIFLKVHDYIDASAYQMGVQKLCKEVLKHVRRCNKIDK